MSQMLNDAIDWIITQLELGIEIGEPSLVILINALIIGGVVAFALGRVRAELRSQQWTNLTPEERRTKLYEIAKEAWTLAEWLLSDIKPVDPAQKRMVGAKKKAEAVKYAKRELRALGASTNELLTAGDQIERVAAEMKNGYGRFTQVRITPQ